MSEITNKKLELFSSHKNELRVDTCREFNFLDNKNLDAGIDYSKELQFTPDFTIDDNGKIYKGKTGELIPDNEYVRNGVTYQTDRNGQIVSWKATLNKVLPETERDEDAQKRAGGKDRLVGDDGGHLEACSLGGASGNENLVAMRHTINKGDYKICENRIVGRIGNGYEVNDEGAIYRDNPASTRPTRIERTISYDDTIQNWYFDNTEGSTYYLEGLKNVLSERNYSNLENCIKDMKSDGKIVSLTSVCKEMDSFGNIKNVTVGLKDESVSKGGKIYKKFNIIYN